MGAFVEPYATAAQTAGDPVEVLRPDGADHFDIITPGTPNGDKVIDFIATRAFGAGSSGATASPRH